MGADRRAKRKIKRARRNKKKNKLAILNLQATGNEHLFVGCGGSYMNPSVSDAPDWPNLELTMDEATLQVGSELPS